MERDSAMPRDASSYEKNSRLSLQSPSFLVTSVYPEQFRDQDIFNPRHPGSIVKRDRSAEPFDAHINGYLGKNSDSTRFFIHVVVLEAVSVEVADVNASKRMNFASNLVLGKNPKFVDLRLSIVNTADKFNSVFSPVARAEVLTDHSNWLASRHSIVEVTADRVNEAKEYRNHIKNSKFETRNVFERENIQLTRQDLTRQDENIQLTRLNENIPMTHLTENIPMTQLNENSPLTQPTEFSENEKGHVLDNPDPEPSLSDSSSKKSSSDSSSKKNKRDKNKNRRKNRKDEL